MQEEVEFHQSPIRTNQSCCLGLFGDGSTCHTRDLHHMKPDVESAGNQPGLQIKACRDIQIAARASETDSTITQTLVKECVSIS